MNNKIKDIIKEALKGYTIEKVILFGSRARGDYNDDSDYDILIALKEDLLQQTQRDLTHKVLQKLAVSYIAADVIISSSEYIKTAKNEIGNVINYAMEEGVAI